MDFHETCWRDVVQVKEKPIKYWCESGSQGGFPTFQHFNIFTFFPGKNSLDLMKKNRHFKGTDISECVQFGADQNKNPDLVNLNVVQ